MTNPENTIIDRIRDIMAHFGYNQSAMAEAIGVKQPNLSAILSGKRACEDAVVNKIVLSLDINKDWLLSGKGTKFRREEISVGKFSPNSENIDTLVSEQKGQRMIPFYDAETTGGYNGRVASSNTSVTLHGYINAGDWFAGRETAAIRHVGDSMVEYPDGCVLAVKEVREFRLLVPGRNYVVETDEYRITKRVQKGHSADCIALYSSNQEKYDDGRLVYEPFEVMLSDVRHIYSILGYIVNQSGEARLITR